MLFSASQHHLLPPWWGKAGKPLNVRYDSGAAGCASV